MRDRLARVIDPAKVEVGLSLALRASDIVITPYGKSGTTWTQQIVHTLRTRGDMDFDDISRVVPWIEASPSLGLDLSAEQKASPRAFKSHLDADTVPKGGRYINVVRHPGDALLSMYKFMEGWLFEPGTIPLEAFATGDFLESRKYYVHLRSWWARRQDADVLFLAYEKMLLDPESTIRRIAAFCDIELDDELLAITLDHSSLTFMSRHKDRFDDAMIRQRSETVGGLPAGSDSSKVREGKSSSGAGLPASVQDALSRAWHEEITETLGYASYDALLENLDA
jgi:hypothetical protein